MFYSFSSILGLIPVQYYFVDFLIWKYSGFQLRKIVQSNNNKINNNNDKDNKKICSIDVAGKQITCKSK